MRADAVIMVDWSGGADRGATPKKDAIWLAEARAGAVDDPVYLRNRVEAEDWLRARLTQAVARDERLLVGFDFPFGYPAGFAKGLTGSADPFAVWSWVTARIHDTRDGRDRWDVAAEANRAFPGDGPFWFKGVRREVPGLPAKKPATCPVSEWREAERRAKGAFSCWQLGGAGSVGSQVLMGLPVLDRLRRAFPVAVWPFEPLDAPIAFVEIWPSLIAQEIAGAMRPGEIKDAAQVRILAQRISEMEDQARAQILDVDAPEEGWIFGLGHEHILQQRHEIA